MSKIIIEHLYKTYGTDGNYVKALNDVSFTVEDKSFTAIVGASGSGKSTLLHIIGGLDKPTSGKVWINGVDVHGIKNEDNLTLFRRKNIGFVFQNYNLIPVLNVWDNIIFPLSLEKKAIDTKYVDSIIDALGLTQKTKALPSQLSGGQQQRVAIARALCVKPAVLLMDEPTGNLDSRTSHEVIEVVRWSAQRYRQTVIMITHNSDIACAADHILELKDGVVLNEKGKNYSDAQPCSTEDCCF